MYLRKTYPFTARSEIGVLSVELLRNNLIAHRIARHYWPTFGTSAGTYSGKELEHLAFYTKTYTFYALKKPQIKYVITLKIR